MTSPLLKRLSEKVLILDGAVGTNIQKFNLKPEDFGGYEGCTEALNLFRPDVVSDIHESFLKIGCDAIETNTFGASRVVLAEYGLQDKVVQINEKAARIAKEIAQKYSTPEKSRFVVGSVGPGTKLPSLGHISFDELKDSYKEQYQGLIVGGVDAILIETCQDILQAKIAIIAAVECFKTIGKRLPIFAQVTFEASGTMLLGTEIESVIATLEMFPVDVIGINCATGPKEMEKIVRVLSEKTTKFISVLPNAGLPENRDGVAHYHLTPDELADFHERFVKEYGVTIVGGCCGTTPEHLKAVVERVQNVVPKKREVKREPSCSCLYNVSAYKQEPAPLMIGEQTNANGSKKFRELLDKEDFDAITEVAKEAVREGAKVVDLCVAYVGRDEKKDMSEAITRFNQQVTVPIMVDSTEADVIEEALKRVAGKPIINSINLEDGGARLRKICPLAKKYGAALVALTIDERGMAKTWEEKIRVMRRIYQMATQQYGIRPEDLFFDLLTFTVGSGSEEFRTAAIETLKALRKLKKDYPDVQTILGVSNISFGLSPAARQTLNSVFLHECVEAGLDAAIVNAKKIIPFFKISTNDLDAAKRLLRNQWIDGKDPLQAYIERFTEEKTAERLSAAEDSSIEEILKAHIRDGNSVELDSHLKDALKKYKPLEIINKFLLEGMKEVGELFAEGKTQLPFVLQSAETMKKAVAILEPRMEKQSSVERGRIVLATVQGDVHDIGKNLVDILLTNNGYKVFNIGIKQSVDAIVNAAIESKADAIGLSGLLVKSTYIMKENLEEMRRRRISIPVICGGAALNEQYVKEVLDAAYGSPVFYARDAFSSLRIMESIKGRSSEATAKETPKENKKEEIAPNLKIESAQSNVPKIDTGTQFQDNNKKKTNSNVLRRVDGVPYGELKAKGPEFFIHRDNFIPEPPFWGYRVMKNIKLKEVLAWVNKHVLYRSQWQFKQGDRTSREFDFYLEENVRPIFERFSLLAIKDKVFEPAIIYGFYHCYSENNDLVIVDGSGKAELTRFSFPRQTKEPRQCISDFFLPKGEKLDVVALQAVTIGKRANEYGEKLYKKNRYAEYFYLHGLSTATAEALAEYTHKMIRTELSISTMDKKTKDDIFRQGYQGARYSLGYAACPNLEDHKKIFELLPAQKIGISLSESLQLFPEQSTTAIIIHHPQAKYFSV